jgi:hypothetical protein
MEQRPHSPGDDHERGIPELERLWPGEIDMTGVVRQDDALVDVIGDAIGEAEASGGEVPEWGARTLARALANERDDPQSGALHHFAVTGRADRETIFRELARIYEGTADGEVKEWVNWLGTYIVNLRDDESQAERPQSRHSLEAGDRQRSEEKTSIGGPAAQFTEHLNRVAAEADARGEPLALEDIRAAATMLAGFLVSMGIENSAMIRLADTGEVDLLRLKVECQQLKAIDWKMSDVHVWAEHLERYLFRK